MVKSAVDFRRRRRFIRHRNPMSSGASKVTCARSLSARASSVSPVGTRCRVSVRPANLLSLRWRNPAGSDSFVSSSWTNPFRPTASVSVRRRGAVRPENGLPARPEAAFRPKMPSRRAGTPLSDLPTPIGHAKTLLSAPTAPFQSAKTSPSDLFSPLPTTQPTQPKPFSHKTHCEHYRRLTTEHCLLNTVPKPQTPNSKRQT